MRNRAVLVAVPPPAISRTAESIVEVAPMNAPGLTRSHLIELYEANWSSLLRTATWLLGDRSLAEEVVQDAFIRLVERWFQLDDDAAAPAWLRSTVVNLSRSRLRRFVVGRQKVNLAGSRAQRADMSADRLGEELADGELGQAIRALPRRQRECVVLRFVHDLPVAEIAETLSIGSGSVKTHLHRGLKTLGEELEGPQMEDRTR